MNHKTEIGIRIVSIRQAAKAATKSGKNLNTRHEPEITSVNLGIVTSKIMRGKVSSSRGNN